MLRNKLEITNHKAENGLMIGLSKDADWTLFEKLVRYIESDFKAKLVKRIDGLDQRYWDLSIDGKQLTLHLDTFAGISILSDENDDMTNEWLINIATKLEFKFNKLINRL